jgi:DHA1 family multidrug resistance protein-like MFS transporter
MVSDLLRDSPFGHVVRLVSGNKFFSYAEERDPSLLKQFLNEKKSGYAAYHGRTTAPDNDDEAHRVRQSMGPNRNANGSESETSSRTHTDGRFNEASGLRIDPEKGKDLHIVDWYGDDDPQVGCATSLYLKYFWRLTRMLEPA